MLCSFRQHALGKWRCDIRKKRISALPHWPAGQVAKGSGAFAQWALYPGRYLQFDYEVPRRASDLQTVC
jgi:hypothetical protein